jgi:hypothetical protein
MGMFAEVAGWLSLDEERLTKALDIIKADGDSRDYPAGLFRVEYESEAAPAELWQISGGVLRVEKGG